MSAPRRTPTLAVYGGAFDPPHVGHVTVPALIRSLTDAHQVLVLPTFSHPFDKAMAPFNDRLDMCKAAFALFGRAVQVSPLEKRLSSHGVPSWTIHTLDAVAAANAGARVRLVIGADAAAELEAWKDHQRIRERYDPLVIGRVGHAAPPWCEPLPAPPEVSSTAIRAALAGGVAAPKGLPRTVLSLIRSRGLYRANGTAAGDEGPAGDA